jgi:hypothetical protein
MQHIDTRTPFGGFVDEQIAAQILGSKVTTLRHWRFRRTGPKFHKFNRSVRYSMDSLQEYARQCEVQL